MRYPALFCNGDCNRVGNAEAIHQWQGWGLMGTMGHKLAKGKYKEKLFFATSSVVMWCVAQRPINPSVLSGQWRDLAVGMWYWMHSWYGQPEAKIARGAGAWDLMQWATGSHAGSPNAGGGGWGSWGLLITLGGAALPKLRCWGVAWNV